jgi:ornithine cyclodeaminase
VIDAVRQALIWQAEGIVQSPMPGQLLFDEPHGDCHIKYGCVPGNPTFVIKVATGFYDNPKLGLPVNQGLVLVFDARTGVPQVLLRDDGWLTAWRTAAATALAAETLAPEEVCEIGIVGTGLQASLAIEWLPETLGDRPFAVWGRNVSKAEALAMKYIREGVSVRAVVRIEELLNDCSVIVTATPSKEPLFDADLAQPGTHFVALGADSPGKQELPSKLFARAAHILTDDHAQCLDHGDFGNAVRSGCAQPDADVMLGCVLSGRVSVTRAPEDISIADLTGIAAEDIAVADLFSALLND